jgi:hypothetical protein
MSQDTERSPSTVLPKLGLYLRAQGLRQRQPQISK